MKKGQLLSQPFIYISALILGALILVWGINTVMNLKSTADAVDLGKFKNDIQAEAQAFYNYGEGSMKQIPIQLSGNVKFVCFSNPGEELNCKYKDKSGELKDCPGGLKALDNGEDTFELLLGEEANKNMWLLPLGTARVDSFTVQYIKPIAGANPLCYSNGRDLTMVSKGTHVELK